MQYPCLKQVMCSYYEYDGYGGYFRRFGHSRKKYRRYFILLREFL
jgi:hypothetical protein